jgi:YebC/PmpR family DNA-binding regulatory protein
MSGHSKWATIKRQKGANDARRGQLFTKLAREISLAARDGADPNFNFKLRLIIDKARASNMPKENIERAVKRGAGTGEDGAVLEEVSYEGYGPHGVAILMQVVTDNRNRTVSEIRHLFTKHGGNLGGAGSVAYMFKPKAVISIAAGKTTEDKLMEIALDAGADDIVSEAQGFTVYATPHSFEAVREALKKAGIEPDEAEIKKLADTNVALEGTKAQQLLKLVEALDDQDDVQNVWDNSDISEAEMEAAAAS